MINVIAIHSTIKFFTKDSEVRGQKKDQIIKKVVTLIFMAWRPASCRDKRAIPQLASAGINPCATKLSASSHVVQGFSPAKLLSR